MVFEYPQEQAKSFSASLCCGRGSLFYIQKIRLTPLGLHAMHRMPFEKPFKFCKE